MTTSGVLSEDEIECLDRIRDSNNCYATDTKAVGQLLVQAAVVDSNQRVVFSGHVHHDFATVEELWQLATDMNGGGLTSVESIGLRRAFGSPFTPAPQRYSLAWLNEQWRLLKEKAPDLQIAEWSMHPHDRVLYERNLSVAGYNPDDVLPETTAGSRRCSGYCTPVHILPVTNLDMFAPYTRRLALYSDGMMP